MTVAELIKGMVYMTKEQAWDALMKVLSVNDLYTTEDSDLNYLLGYLDVLKDSVEKGAETND